MWPAAFATASQAPTSSASQTGVMNALNGLASTFSNVSGTITSLQNQVDQQVVNSVGSTNTLIQQIYQLNSQIKTANGHAATRPPPCSTSATPR